MVQEVGCCRRWDAAGGGVVQEVRWCRRWGGAVGGMVYELWWYKRWDGEGTWGLKGGQASARLDLLFAGTLPSAPLGLGVGVSGIRWE